MDSKMSWHLRVVSRLPAYPGPTIISTIGGIKTNFKFVAKEPKIHLEMNIKNHI